MSKLFPFSPSVEGKPLVKKIVHFVDLSCCVCMYVCMCVCMHVLVVRFLERVVSIALTLFSFSIFSHFYWNNLLFFFFLVYIIIICHLQPVSVWTFFQ